jgi:hypothetical protein
VKSPSFFIFSWVQDGVSSQDSRGCKSTNCVSLMCLVFEGMDCCLHMQLPFLIYDRWIFILPEEGEEREPPLRKVVYLWRLLTNSRSCRSCLKAAVLLAVRLVPKSTM